VHVALDFDNYMGNAGKVAKLLGAVFGKEAVHNKAYVGVGLRNLDGGMVKYQTLASGALEQTGKTSPADVVALLAAEHPLNAANIDLAGLAQTGLGYLPYTG
jgi:hypothetical protein